jgi:hypothetical protein
LKKGKIYALNEKCGKFIILQLKECIKFQIPNIHTLEDEEERDLACGKIKFIFILFS